MSKALKMPEIAIGGRRVENKHTGITAPSALDLVFLAILQSNSVLHIVSYIKIEKK